MIEKNGNKRRFVESKKAGPQINQLPYQYPPTLSKQQTVPLTPNLKHSDPFSTGLQGDRFILKRSNSQTEFDLPLNNLMDHPDFDMNSFNHHGQNEDFIGNEIPHLEKSFSLPAHAHQNLGAAFLALSSQFGQYPKPSYRNSFDFLELES